MIVYFQNYEMHMIETVLSKICAFHTRCARSTMPILCPRKTQSVQTRKSLPIPPYELRIFSFRKSFDVSANFSNCFVPLFSILSSSNFLKSLIYHRFDLVFQYETVTNRALGPKASVHSSIIWYWS